MDWCYKFYRKEIFLLSHWLKFENETFFTCFQEIFKITFKIIFYHITRISMFCLVASLGYLNRSGALEFSLSLLFPIILFLCLLSLPACPKCFCLRLHLCDRILSYMRCLLKNFFLTPNHYLERFQSCYKLVIYIPPQCFFPLVVAAVRLRCECIWCL